MLLGHVQVALANGLRGDNPFSDACLIAMDYGREQDHQGRLEVDLRRRRARLRAEADAAPGQDPPLILLDGAETGEAMIRRRTGRPGRLRRRAGAGS